MKNGQSHLFSWEEYDSILSLVETEFPSNEYNEVEYKSAQGGFPKEFWKTYSAFANTNTGIILLGVEEKKDAILLEGLTDEQIERYQKYFWDNCNNPNTVNRNLLTNKDVRIIEIEDKRLLAFHIPFARRTERPIYLTRNPFGNTYKRNHEGDYRCTDEEVKRMLADSTAELQRDSLILEHYTLSDLDPATIKQFRQLFISSRPGHPWHALNDLDLLTRIGAYRVDRKTGIEGITLGGLLMFGKEKSLKEQEALPNYFPDFRELLSTDPQIRWTDRIYPDGTWECNLLQFYLKIWPKLSSTLPKPFALKGDERTDETPTHTALREAFVNALVHTDYSLSGNIIIELNTEAFVFSNPGTLLVSIEQYYAGGISECRNPTLQGMFLLIGRAEKAGSGVDKIMFGWNDSHWRQPYLELQLQPDRVKLTLPMFSVIPESVLEELNIIFGDVSSLSADELTTLSFCLIEDSISNHRLQYILGIHRVDITVLLKNLCLKGYLESDNNGRWTTYRINQKGATSNQKDATSNQKGATSNQKGATSDQKADLSSRKNMKREELNRLILAICKDNYVKREELAVALGRSEDYLRNKILPDLVKRGKLEKRFPFTHNHPEQGYKTSEEH
ncbi:RNA-binding domain-containing protein [Parabacteroides sp. PF5-6]|uniref:RNA-binding domain-containing protein n=1 Tax=Parabacteroides sp. PF5-6 TaxID=1742403 RepID=UPI002405500A|nr:RNA-binding domain-containing protein [Parabacteroides sp. PF5-6]MDF9829228.1 ATP-dependent DNA helicase RecG [Parabacteroides sp. PF5-6]